MGWEFSWGKVTPTNLVGRFQVPQLEGTPSFIIFFGGGGADRNLRFHGDLPLSPFWKPRRINQGHQLPIKLSAKRVFLIPTSQFVSTCLPCLKASG